MKQFLLASGIVFGLVYFVLVGWIYATQRTLLYRPNTNKPVPAAAGLADMKAVSFKTTDGLEIYGWYKPAAYQKPTVIYFHGNAGNLLNHSWIARPLLGAGYGVLLVEYRGFGGNPGTPTEAGLYADGRAAIEYLKANRIGENDMIFFGMSLGTGVAIKMATEFSPSALILQSPYSSITDTAKHHYWYVPVGALIKDEFDSMEIIKQATAPLFVVYAGADEVIPPELSVDLFEAANAPKTLKLIEGAGHNDLADAGGIDAVLEFLAETLNQ